MRISICGKVLLAGCCMMAGSAAWAQTPASLDVAVTYNAMMANVAANGDNFWMQGGSAQLRVRLWSGLGAVADIAGLHTARAYDSGPGLDLITATFGPRYTWSPPHRRLSLFGEFLVGEVHGMNSIFPSGTATPSSANSFALQAGGGVNVPFTPRLAVRVFEADWLRTQLPNSTTNVQNNLRLGAGLVFRIK